VSCWALVPVKARTEGKRRLSPVLDEDGRICLVRAMLEHVLSVLATCPGVDDIAVLTPERDALPANIRLLPDAGRGVNEALREALQTLGRVGVKRVAIVAADLPLVSPDEVESLVEASQLSGIAIAPDRRGGGTNAVCVTVPTPFEFHFGPGSLVRHVAEAAKLGVTPAIVALPGLAFDVDEPDDLALLKTHAAASASSSPGER